MSNERINQLNTGLIGAYLQSHSDTIPPELMEKALTENAMRYSELPALLHYLHLTAKDLIQLEPNCMPLPIAADTAAVFDTLRSLPSNVRESAFPLLTDIAGRTRAHFWTGATATGSGPTKRVLMAYYRFVPTTGRRNTTSDMIEQIPSLQDALKNRHGFTRMRFTDLPLAASLLDIPLKWVLGLPETTPCLTNDLALDNLICLYEELGPTARLLFRTILMMYVNGVLSSIPIVLPQQPTEQQNAPDPHDPKTIAADVCRKILTSKESFEKYYDSRREFFQTEITKQLMPLTLAERRKSFPQKIVRMKDCVTGLRLLPVEAWRPFITRFYGSEMTLHEFIMGYRTLEDPVYRFDTTYAALCASLPDAIRDTLQNNFSDAYTALAPDRHNGLLALLNDYAEEIGVHPFNIYSIRVCNMRIKDGELRIQGDKKAIAARANLAYIYHASNKPTLKQLMLLSLYTGISIDRLVAAATSVPTTEIMTPDAADDVDDDVIRPSCST